MHFLTHDLSLCGRTCDQENVSAARLWLSLFVTCCRVMYSGPWPASDGVRASFRYVRLAAWSFCIHVVLYPSNNLMAVAMETDYLVLLQYRNGVVLGHLLDG